MIKAKNPTFTIDFGCMFSGKSQELLRRCSKFVDSLASIEQKREGEKEKEKEKIDRVLLITYKGQEDRNVASKTRGITTHANNFQASPFLKVREVFELKEIEEKELENVTFIGIDESFYPDLYIKVKEWFLERRISISISCLDGDFKQEILSPQIMQLIPYSTKIIKHSAYCHKCLEEGVYENAYYTIKVNNNSIQNHIKGNMCPSDITGLRPIGCKPVLSDGHIDFGGKDKYKAVCFNHLNT